MSVFSPLLSCSLSGGLGLQGHPVGTAPLPSLTAGQISGREWTGAVRSKWVSFTQTEVPVHSKHPGSQGPEGHGEQCAPACREVPWADPLRGQQCPRSVVLALGSRCPVTGI